MTRSYLVTDSPPLSEAEQAAMRARYPQDSVIKDLDERGLPLTRENYILNCWGPESELPSDEEWTAEHEASLPREFCTE
jgi:hypothetical protein